MSAKTDRHVCDDRCVCPVHSTPLFYSPSADDHACQDITCENGHGLKEAMPVQLGVRCDHDDCGEFFEADFLIADDSTRDERLLVVLRHVERKLGWQVVGADDPGTAETFCPAHAPATTEEGQ